MIFSEINDDSYIVALRDGLPFEVATDLAARMDVNLDELARMLNISADELEESQSSGRLTLAQGNRFARIERLYADIEDLLGKDAGAWLRESLPGLQDKTPLELLDTEPGVAKVSTLITQLNYGIYT